MTANILETLNYEDINSRLQDEFVALMPEHQRQELLNTLMLESEPITKLIEMVAYLEVILRNRVNAAARANLLAFATDKDLDRLAEFYGIVRFDNETDSKFKERIVARIQGSSTAGPIAHYRYHAMSASPLVDEVVITTHGRVKC